MILVTTWNVLILKTVSYVVFCKKNVICLPTEHQGVHKNSFRNVRAFQDRIGIWKCWFLRRGENRSTRRKTSRSRVENNNKLKPHMTPGPGIEPGPHWWEANALTTAPTLLPCDIGSKILIISLTVSHGSGTISIHVRRRQNKSIWNRCLKVVSAF